MGQIQRLEWNDRAQNALFIGVICGITALACRQLSRSSWRLQPETRDVFRDISIVSGTFSLAGLLFAYGLALPEKSASKKPNLKSPQGTRKGSWAEQLEEKAKPLEFTGDVIYPVTDANRKELANDRCILSCENIEDLKDLIILCCNDKQYGFDLESLLGAYRSSPSSDNWRHPQIDTLLTETQKWAIKQLLVQKN